MKPTPLVSIIIPTYNRAHLIGETLDSILAQTYQNWECIVVDDGSTDATENVVLRYQERDARISYYQRPKHQPKGANACRNYGFEQSSGDFVQWFDSDDCLHREALKLKIKTIEEKRLDVLVSNSVEDLSMLDADIDYEVYLESKFIYNEVNFPSDKMITGSVFLRRSIIGHVNFDEQLFKGQDFDFFYRCFVNRDLAFGYINCKLQYHRLTTVSISKNSKAAKTETLIYLADKMMKNYSFDTYRVERFKYQVRKLYRDLILSREFSLIFTHFKFFKNCFQLSTISFFLYILYNTITKKGFDRIKA